VLTKWVAATGQRRATQSWTKMSCSAGAAVGATGSPSPAGNSDAANQARNGDQSECGDNAIHVGGRSRVIHANLVGFWCVGELPDDELWANRLVGWE
jgi:hypothetical protein